MKASQELNEKLQKRLSLQNEEMPGTPQRFSSSPAIGAASPISNKLRSRLGEVTAERDKALEHKRKTEDLGIHRSVELSSEVARLRVDVEVMRKQLAEAMKEVHELRIQGERNRSRDQQLQEQQVNQDLELAVAEARVQHLAQEAATSAEERCQLEEQVLSLEEEVAEHVVSRVRLEAQLRKSEVREAEMRKLLDVAEAGRKKIRKPTAQFSIHLDDEEGEEKPGVPDDANAQDMDELEWAYEAAELAGTMSLERALELARAGAGYGQEKPGETEAGEAAETAEGTSEDEYEAPLRELELALARIRGGAGSGGADDASEAEGRSPSAGAAGTGEAADSLEFHNINLLQQVLGRLNASKAAEALVSEETEPEDQQAGAPAPRGAPEAEAEEVVLRAAEEVSAPPEELAPASEIVLEEAPPPAVPSSGGEAEAGPPGSPQAPLVGFGLFSPYAMLGQKYRNILGQ